MITGVLVGEMTSYKITSGKKYTVPLIILYIVELILKAFDVMHDRL